MSMLEEKDRAKVRERLEKMAGPVRLVHFTRGSGEDCPYCPQTLELLEDLATLNEHLSVEVHDLDRDPETAGAYGVDKAPATVLVGDRDRGIRYYGIPAGYEFASLLEDIVMISTGDSGLSAVTRARLRDLEDPVHLQVFVTPTCPYCSGAVRLAHQFALESDRVTADMVEATEFPELSARHQVAAVPKTVANDRTAAEGMLPEDAFLDQVLLAAEK